ncbi:MAG: aspartate kinase [Limnochordia bacterium]
MRILVQKYGGSSVANPERIKNVAQRVVAAKKAGYHVVTVVSALGDTTDELLTLASQVTDKPPKREIDMLLSTGEQVSVALLAMAVDALGEPVISLTGAQCGIITDASHTKAKILQIKAERILEELTQNKIVIAAGFQGITNTNDITTLGRGGSDTTAVALAAALEAEACEIYTDVDGVYTADPRVVPEARKLSAISYGEMLEMARLGAGVMQPRAVEVAAQYGIPIVVRSSFSDAPGTIIKGEADVEKDVVVTGVTHDTNVAKFVIIDVPDQPGVAAKLFSSLADKNINVDMIVQTNKQTGRTDMLFTVSQDEMGPTKEILDEICAELGAEKVICSTDVAKVSIVGAGMVSNPGVAAAMFAALAEESINIEVISTSEIKISCLVAKDAVTRAVQAVHRKFELEEE